MSGRARPRAVLVGLLLLVASPVPLARAASESRSAPTQDGWWNRFQGRADGEPEGNPVRPLAPAVPTPPTVPADAIATSAGAGQVDKIAAVGIDLTLADGAGLGGLTLRLKESPAGGANVGAEAARVTACPATVPWGPGPNAAWRERPSGDCGLGSAKGARAADGTWTFDLTAIARRWADPAAPLAPDGVVLAIDPAASPSPVQVSWLDVETGTVAVELTVSSGGAGSAPAAGTADAAPAGDAPAGRAGPGGSGVVAGAGTGVGPAAGAASSPGGVISADAFAIPSGPAPGAAATAIGSAVDASGSGAPTRPPAEAGAALTASPGTPVPVLHARPAVDFWEHVPASTTLLVPIAAALGVLVGLVLGPRGRPSPLLRREGGLSRALARRGAGPSPPTANG